MFKEYNIKQMSINNDINATDINNYDYVRKNYLDLQTQYELFNYNNIDTFI